MITLSGLGFAPSPPNPAVRKGGALDEPLPPPFPVFSTLNAGIGIVREPAVVCGDSLICAPPTGIL